MKRALGALLVSVGLGVAGLFFVTRDALLDPAIYRLRDPDPVLVFVAIVSFVVLWVPPYLRLQLLARIQGRSLGAGSALLAHVMTVFGSALTPSGSGGGPALVTALSRLGIPYGTGLGIAVQLFILDLVVFGWLIPASLVYVLFFSDVALSGAQQAAAFVAATVAIGGALALGRYPRPVVRALLWLAGRPRAARFAARLRKSARDYYSSARAFAVMPQGTWLVLQVVSMLGWLASFVLLWSLLLLYGVPTVFLDLIAVLSVITVISFVVPTPGASGFIEVAVGLATAGAAAGASTGAAAGGSIAAPLLVWRTLSFYVIYAFGPLATWLLFRRERVAKDPRFPPRT